MKLLTSLGIQCAVSGSESLCFEKEKKSLFDPLHIILMANTPNTTMHVMLYISKYSAFLCNLKIWHKNDKE